MLAYIKCLHLSFENIWRILLIFKKNLKIDFECNFHMWRFTVSISKFNLLAKVYIVRSVIRFFRVSITIIVLA